MDVDCQLLVPAVLAYPYTRDIGAHRVRMSVGLALCIYSATVRNLHVTLRK
jgi:hypothetical protein